MRRACSACSPISPRACRAPPRLRFLPAPDSDKRHLLIVCTAERGLCGAFNSSIARLARDRANALIAEGKSVKFICVGKKGYDILKRLFEKDILEVVDLRGVKQIGFGNAQAIADKVIERFGNGEFDVATLFYARFRSVIQQIPTAQRIIPADTSARRGGRRSRQRPDSTSSSRTRARFSPRSCRATSRCRSIARSSRMWLPRWAPR